MQLFIVLVLNNSCFFCWVLVFFVVVIEVFSIVWIWLLESLKTILHTETK